MNTIHPTLTQPTWFIDSHSQPVADLAAYGFAAALVGAFAVSIVFVGRRWRRRLAAVREQLGAYERA